MIDFETASSCDLKKAGAWRYAQDPTTEILCLGLTDGEEFTVLPPELLAYLPTGKLGQAVADPDCYFVAHNVAFEKAIWRNLMVGVFGWPDIPNDRWHDIMAACAMKALPLKLERAASALGLRHQKDTDGSRITKSLSRPNKAGSFNRDNDILRRVYDYNKSDLLAELELHRRVRGLGEAERRVWLLDQKINERGVRLDLEFIAQCQRIVAQATGPLASEFRELTGVNPGQRDKVIAWLNGNGCEIPDLKKETVTAYLDPDEEESDAGDDEDYRPDQPQLLLPFSADRALRIRQILGSTSIKKLSAMQSCVCADGRAYGLLQYHAAGPGRWGGRLLQPQNFPRPTWTKVDGDKSPDQDAVIAALMTGDAEYVRMMFGEPISVVSSSLRHTIIASKGKNLAVGDFAKIECVIVLALAGAHATAKNVIERGSAVYTDAATQIFGFPVTKNDLKEYTIGKNSILGCGFQMGWKKFKLRYWKDATDEAAKEVIDWYRGDFAPEVPLLWRGLENAAINTVWTGKAHQEYGVTYAMEDGWLTARLPSGRKLWYYDPRPVRKAMPWDRTDVRPGFEYSAYKMGQWRRVSAYGGLLTENVVQALARDLLVNALYNCEANDYPVILTVHDEVVAERANADAKVLDTLLCDRPQWAKDLQIPVAAECWTGDRYRK